MSSLLSPSGNQNLFTNKRIEALEKKLKTSKKQKSTLGQKMLILQFLGVLDKINGLKIKQGDKITLLSYLLDAHEKQIEPNFNGRGRNLDSPLSNESNYKFLVKLFTEIKLPDEKEKAEMQLEKIKRKKTK